MAASAVRVIEAAEAPAFEFAHAAGITVAKVLSSHFKNNNEGEAKRAKGHEKADDDLGEFMKGLAERIKKRRTGEKGLDINMIEEVVHKLGVHGEVMDEVKKEGIKGKKEI